MPPTRKIRVYVTFDVVGLERGDRATKLMVRTTARNGLDPLEKVSYVPRRASAGALPRGARATPR
jgi:hypothetical protein